MRPTQRSQHPDRCSDPVNECGAALERSVGAGATGGDRGGSDDVGSALDLSAGLGGTTAPLDPAADRAAAPAAVRGDPASALALSSGLGGTGLSDRQARALPAGTRLGGRYEVFEQLGAGGMGAVYRALDQADGHEVALKVMLPSLTRRQKANVRFQQEAAVMAELDHDGIVGCLDVGTDARLGVRYLAMELLRGRSLRQWLQGFAGSEEGVPVASAFAIARQLLSALAYAHRTAIHRDLKPENVFVLEGDPLRVKILDFGIAKRRAATTLTATDVALGTAYYMAPEQRADAARVDARADLFSVAVILYELLTGKVPIGRFAAPSEVRPELGAEVDALVLRGLDEDPAGRYADAAAFLEALGDAERVLAAAGRPPLPAVVPGRAIGFWWGAVAFFCGGYLGAYALLESEALGAGVPAAAGLGAATLVAGLRRKAVGATRSDLLGGLLALGAVAAGVAAAVLSAVFFEVAWVHAFAALLGLAVGGTLALGERTRRLVTDDDGIEEVWRRIDGPRERLRIPWAEVLSAIGCYRDESADRSWVDLRDGLGRCIHVDTYPFALERRRLPALVDWLGPYLVRSGLRAFERRGSLSLGALRASREGLVHVASGAKLSWSALRSVEAHAGDIVIRYEGGEWHVPWQGVSAGPATATLLEELARSTT